MFDIFLAVLLQVRHTKVYMERLLFVSYLDVLKNIASRVCSIVLSVSVI